MDTLNQLLESPTFRKVAIDSGTVVLVVMLLRFIAVRLVRRVAWAADSDRLNWLVRIRAVTVLILVFGLVVVWADDLRTVAISAVAIAAALVIATKELIMCISGTFVRVAAQSYSVGDRIEIGAVRGDVIGYGLLTTTVLEVGPAQRRTGRAVVLPNSLLLTQPVINETYSEAYVLHTFVVPVGTDRDWKHAEKALLEAVRAVCADTIEEARAHLEASARRAGISPPEVQPRVLFQLPAEDRIDLLVRVPTLAREIARTEQDILRRFLDATYVAPSVPPAPVAPPAPAADQNQ